MTVRIHSNRPSKYRNKVTLCDGLRFDSKKEAARWQDLRLAERAGLIADLRRQVRYDFVVNGVTLGYYVADFTYVVTVKQSQEHAGKRIVEDVKGCRTAMYRLKKKLMKALHDIEIKET